MGRGRLSLGWDVPECRMEPGVSVLLRHVFPQRSASGAATWRMLHRYAVFCKWACRASFDDYAGLFSISYSRPILDRTLERRIRQYRFQQWTGCVYRASGLYNRSPRTARV